MYVAGMTAYLSLAVSSFLAPPIGIAALTLKNRKEKNQKTIDEFVVTRHSLVGDFNNFTSH